MKQKFLTMVVGALSLLAVAACSPSASQLKKAMQDNPEILHAAIEADPAGFFEAVQRAQGNAREKGMAKQMEEEFKRVMGEIKEAKTMASVDTSRAVVGSTSAKVTIVEWADFKCGYCSKAADTMKQVAEAYGDKVKIQYKHLPILSEESRTAAEVMEAIALSDKQKALKFHDIMFTKQAEFRTGGKDFIKSVAKEVGADWAQVQKDMKDSRVKKAIEADVEEAQKFGFSGTPGFSVNGGTVHGALPFEFFKKVIDELLKEGQG